MRSALFFGVLAALALCLSSIGFAQPWLTPISEESDEGRLIAFLKDPDPTIRVQAAERLAVINYFDNRDAVEHALIPMLTADKDARVRSAVALTLGAIDADAAAEPLAACLQDQAPAVRGAAALGLGMLLDTRAIEPVTRLLNDPDAQTRKRAIQVLCGFNNLRTADPILALLEDPDADVRQMAALSLGMLGHPGATDALVGLLKDPDLHCRLNAAAVLAKKHDERATLVLIEALQEKDLEDVQMAIKVLTVYGDARTWEPLLAIANTHADLNTRLLAMRALKSFNDARAVDALLALVHAQEERIRDAAVALLCELAKNHTEQIARAALPMMADKTPAIRQAGKSLALSLKGPEQLPTILALTKDPDADIRCAAYTALAGIPDPTVIPALLEGIHNTNNDIQRVALNALCKCRDPEREQAVIGLLADRDATIRASAVWAIREKCLAHAEDAVAALLRDPVEDIRTAAAMALARLQDPRAFEPLVALQQSANNEIRNNALYGLGELGDIRALPILLDAMKDGEAARRTAAAAGLREFSQKHPAQLFPALPGLLNDNGGDAQLILINTIQNSNRVEAIPTLQILAQHQKPAIRQAAVSALAQMYNAQALPPLLEALHDADPEIRRLAIAGMAHHDTPRATAALFPLLEDPVPAVRKEAIFVLGCLGDVRVLALLQDMLKDGNPAERSRAAESLGSLNDLRAMAPLLAALHDLDSATRSYAAEAIGDLARDHVADPQVQAAVDPLCEAAGDAEPTVRVNALDTLGIIASPRAVPTCLAAVKGEPSFVRAAAITALGKINDARGEQAILTALTDPDVSVQEAACRVTGQMTVINRDRLVEALIPLLRHPDARTRLLAVQRASALRHRRLLQPLSGMVKDPSVQVRQGAAEALSSLRDSAAAEALFALLKDPDTDVMRKAISGFSNMADPRITDRCIALLGDQDAQIRRAVATILGSREDERTIAPLLATLRDPEPTVQMAAMQALERMANRVVLPPTILPLGLDFYKSDQSATRCLGIRLLGLLRDPATAETVLTGMNDADAQVRQYAATAAGSLAGTAMNTPNSRMVTALLPMVTATDSDLRKAVLSALAQYTRDPRIIDPLCHAAEDTDPAIRSHALNLIQIIRDPRVTATLLANYQREKKKSLDGGYASSVYSAAGALSRVMDAHAVDVFLADLPNAAENRNALIYALCQSDDKRVAPALLTYLRDWLVGHDPEHVAGLHQPRSLNITADWGSEGQVWSALGMCRDIVGPLLAAAKDRQQRELRLGAIAKIAQLRDGRAVPTLLDCAGEADPLVRRASVQALGYIGDIRALEPALAMLREPDAKMQATAALALGRLGDARAIPPLRACLHSTDADVLFTAIHALGMLKAREARDEFLQLLGHQDAGVRAQAVWALGEIPDVRAVPPMLDALQDTDIAVRANAVEAIGKLADAGMAKQTLREAAKPLLALLPETPQYSGDWNADPIVALYRNTILTLGKLGDPTAVEPLFNIVETRPWTFNYAAITALGNYADPQTAALLISALRNKSLEYDVTKVLVKMGPPAVEPLLAAVQSVNPHHRRLGVSVLSQMINNGVPVDGRVHEVLDTATTDTDRQVRINALAALALLGNANATERLVALISGLRAADNSSFTAVGYLEDVRLVPVYLAILQQEDADPSLSSLAFAGLQRIAEAHPDAQELRAALPVLHEKMQRKETRQSAALILAHMGDATAIDALLEQFTDLRTPSRKRYVPALGRIADPRALDALIALLHDPETSHVFPGQHIVTVPEQAAITLGERGDVRAVPALIDALGYGNPPFHGCVADALGKLKDQRAVPPLIDAVEHFTGDARQAAVTALTQITGQHFGEDAERWRAWLAK